MRADAAGRVTALPAVSYKPGWSFKIAGPNNSMLCVYADTVDSNDHGRTRCTQHQFEMPVGASEREFIRWMFDRLLLCELHEAGEFFAVNGVRPFMPHHQDEGSPYELVDRTETL